MSRDLASFANSCRSSGVYTAPVYRHCQRIQITGFIILTGLFGLTRTIALVLSVKSDSQSSTFG